MLACGDAQALDLQVIDLIQKISNMRWKYGGQKDEGVCIPKVESGFWIPKVSSPDVSPSPTALQPLIPFLLQALAELSEAWSTRAPAVICRHQRC